MRFSLIICTFQRPRALSTLLKSVKKQSLYPDEIVIVDGSIDNQTSSSIDFQGIKNCLYFKVDESNRGLTKQRNFGIDRVSKTSEIICFLDDDTVLEPDYFKNLISTYETFPKASGVSGYITNESDWKKVSDNYTLKKDEFYYDGWVRIEGSRFKLRRKFGLAPDRPPGFMPSFSNGYSTAFLPPSGKTYNVEFFMGGVSSFKKELLNKIKFSEYFEGYGLYEDMDFCLRASKIGQLYVNTAARLEHHHEPDGRPNQFDYGKMVVRNGWYVWRLKNPNPTFKSKFKWHATALILTLVRLSNSINTSSKKAAFTESLGRINGWCSILLSPPK